MRGLWRTSAACWGRAMRWWPSRRAGFCNGPYFKPFRRVFLEAMSLRRLHVFESRSAAFSGDAVLQENIIFQALKGAPKPKNVIVSSSSGEHGGAVTERAVDFCEVVSQDDAEKFIHLPADDQHEQACRAMRRHSTLKIPR